MNSFQSILHRNHTKIPTSTIKAALDEQQSKKKTKMQLSIKTTTQLASINTTLRKNVRKSHFTNKSQVMTDKQYYREKEKSISKSKKRDKKSIIQERKVDDSSLSIISKHSSNTSSSVGSHEKSWKVKNMFSKKRNSVTSENEKDVDTKAAKKLYLNGTTPLPMVIDVATSIDVGSVIDEDDNEDDFHSVNSSSSSTSTPSSSSNNKEQEDDVTGTVCPTATTKSSYSNNEAPKAKSKACTRPPRPPTFDPKAIENNKTSFPSWLLRLREKQKNRKREERVGRCDEDDDDDNKSVNTVDLENSAVDAVGRHKVISIFGKTVPLRSHSKERNRNMEDNYDDNASPWKVKLKPVDRKSTIGNEKVSRRPLPPSNKTQNDLFPVKSYYSPLSSENSGTSSTQKTYSPQQQIVNYNISPGDVIDLLHLPSPAFSDDEKTHIFSITNNSGNRNQVVVLGEALLLIASRFTNSNMTRDKQDKANILWFTPRSDITTLGLNNKADGVTIAIKNGTSFPLNFESCNQCFSFVQTYYDRNNPQPLVSEPEDDAYVTPIMNRDKSINTTILNGTITTKEDACTSPRPNCAKSLFTPHSIGPSVLEEPSKIDQSVNTDEISSNDATLLKYQRMLKCGIPADAVRHKMSMDGVDIATQEAVFNVKGNAITNPDNIDEQNQSSKNSVADILEIHLRKKVSSEQQQESAKKGISIMLEGHLKKRNADSVPPKSNIASMLESHLKKQLSTAEETKANETNQPLLLSEEEENIASKYRKMIKYGMPLEAVQHAMTKDQISAKIVSAVTTGSDMGVADSTETLHRKENERVLGKFKKMLTLNIARDAVRNKMMLEGVDSALIEELLGSEQPSKQEESSNKSKAFTEEEEAIFEKFKKMSKVGIPQDAIRHAMIKDNIQQTLIDKFLGADQTQSKAKVEKNELNDEEKMKVEQYKKMLKLGLPIGAVRHKMIQENASERIMSAILNNEEKSSTSSPIVLAKRKQSGLVNIYWEKLSVDKIENSVWKDSAKKPKLDKSIDIDIDALKELFKKQTKDKAQSSTITNDKNNISKKANILDNQRAQNVSISLQAFKQFSIDALVHIIDDMDPFNQIKGDRVLFLSGLLPKKEESDAIRQFKGDDKLLSPAEHFFRKLLTVTRVESKIKVIETMELFNQNFEDILSRFKTLSTTCNQVMESEKLQLVLESVLTIGNIMNEGTRSGDAVGIKFNSLLKLTQTKSKDKKLSVLDYIVMMFIEKNERDVLKLSDDFPECATASRIHITDIVSNFSSLESSLKTCKTELSKIKNEQLSQGKQFSPGLLRLEKFMASSDNALSRLQLSRKNASMACKVSLGITL